MGRGRIRGERERERRERERAMGGSSSKDAGVGVYGDLEVHQSGGIAFAGQTLRGNAYLRWNPKVATQTARQFRLTATLFGQERTCIEYQRDEWYDGEYDGVSRNRRTVTDYRRAQNVFLYDSLVLADLNQYNNIRDAKFPFEFHLPAQLPPSMIDPFGGRSKAEVVYGVTIEVQELGGGGGGQNWFSGIFGSGRNIHELPFRLVNPTPDLSRSYPINIPPFQEIVNECCCINRGYMTLSANIPSGMQAAGSEMRMEFCVDNKSKASVSTIIMEVKEKVTWTAANERKTKKRVLAKTQIPYDGKAMQNAMQNISLYLPTDSLESWQGSLISVVHYVKLIWDTGFMTSDPKLSADFFCYTGRLWENAGGNDPSSNLVNPDLAQNDPSAPPVPAGWNPVTAPLVSNQQQQQQQEIGVPVSMPPTPLQQQQIAGAAMNMQQQQQQQQTGQTGIVPATYQTPLNNTAAPDATVDSLVELIRQSFDSISDTQQWVERGGVSMSPQDLGRVMQTVKLKFNQPLVMRELMRSQWADRITCNHVATAALACEESTRGDVVRQMGPHVTDPENAMTIVKPHLSSFQWTLAAPTFSPKK